MIIEGPVATLVAALFASLGAFNVFVVLLLSIIGDIIGDAFFYFLGRKHGTNFVKRFGRYTGITQQRFEKLNEYFQIHGGKTVFAAKSTVGLSWVAFMFAGATKMRMKKFLQYSFLGGLIWSGFLVIMGYFYGYVWRETSEYIEWVGWIVSAIAIISFAVILLYKRRKTRKLFNGKSK